MENTNTNAVTQKDKKRRTIILISSLVVFLILLASIGELIIAL